MIKKMFTVTALAAFALSACSGGAAVESTAPPATDTEIPTALATPTEEATATEVATQATGDASATATSATLPTTTATLGTPIPTNPPDCTNQASFVTDVTIPDNTNVAGGTTFTKTWRIGNTGTCVWGPTYTLSHYSEERLGAPLSVPLALTYPGQTLDISLELTAPNIVGRYQGNFVIKNPAGLIMSIGDDSRLWVIINVTVTSAATAAATTTGTAISNTAAASATTIGSDPNATAIPVSASSSSTATCAFTTDRTKLTEVISAVNAYRAQRGLPAYTVNAQLAQAAQRHANDIACNKLYVHTGTDGSTARSRVADTGYLAKSVSENVNGNYPPLDGQAAVNWWINDKTDPVHGRNLLSTTFTEIGVGYAFFDNYGFYTLVFAQP
jgi:uncharacterized protein YkwD